MKGKTILPLVLLLASLARAQEATLDIRQVDPEAFPLVKLFVSVTDGTGKPITDVAPESFHVTEGGKEVSSPEFPAGGVPPVTSFLVIDRSGSMSEQHKMEQAQEAATRFIEMMRDGDQVGLISFANDVQVMEDPTDNKETLKALVRTLRPNGETACYSAVRKALDRLAGSKARRSIIVLTDGIDNQSDQRGDTLDSATRQAEEQGVPVYTIGVGEDVNEQVLQRLARGTHGAYAFAPTAQELVGLFARQAEQIQKEFVITYRSPNPNLDGTRRAVKVEATWKGKAISGESAYATRGLVPGLGGVTGGGSEGTKPKGVSAIAAFGVFLLLGILLAFLAAVPVLLKRQAALAAAQKGAPLPPAETAPAPEAAKGRVRVIAPTQTPPAPSTTAAPPAAARVRIVQPAEGGAAAPAPATSAPPASPRVRILPAAPPAEASAAATDAAPAPPPSPDAPPPAAAPSDAPPAP